jgi:hypothetical protein
MPLFQRFQQRLLHPKPHSVKQLLLFHADFEGFQFNFCYLHFFELTNLQDEQFCSFIRYFALELILTCRPGTSKDSP